MRKYSITFVLLVTFVCIFFTIYYKINTINKVYISNDDKIVVELNDNIKTFCKINKKWVTCNNKKCILDYTDNNDYIYLKNKFGYIKKFKNKYNLSSIKDFSIKKSNIYLAIGGKEKIDYFLNSIINKDNKIIYKVLDESIATVDKNGIITGKSIGNTKVIISIENYKLSSNIIVTDNIVIKPNDYDYKKQYIKCNEFSNEDNDLIDKILFNRIENAGYKTRAAVVEASRFMTMEFSRRIPYFAENGRLVMNGIDGEGRYYKKGMFLNKSRYSSISKSMHGPTSWGCNMYSYPVNRTIPNGLDCSGFVAWAFINAGFDVGDIGAGITPVNDFTDLGKKIYINESVLNNKIIVGDLLSGSTTSGGHIAIVSGIKDVYYYVSESLYEDNYKYYGVINRKYKFDELKYYFSWHIDMSDFYQTNGNLTNYWTN